MKKKVIVGLGAVGGIIALRSAASRSGHTMSEHCKGMAAKCREMMASQSAEHSGAPEMREHCKEMMAAHGGHGEKTEAPEHREQEAPRFAGNGEAVSV